MHLLLALDQGFEQLAAVSLTSYLLHQRFESVVLVTPEEQRLARLEAIAEGFGTPVVWQPIGPKAALHRLEPTLQPYFFCIEALSSMISMRLDSSPRALASSFFLSCS